MQLFIAISPYKHLVNDDLNHYIEISNDIDLLLLRVPMSRDLLCNAIDYLLTHGFPRDKLMVHTDISVLELYDLHFIHFRENDEQAFLYKESHPHISVSMSTHSVHSVERAKHHHLDFVFFGHVFESSSKEGLIPKSVDDIKIATSIDIPIYAIGGINQDSLKVLPAGFQGICAISFFRDCSIQEIEHLRKVWHAYV
ncbi:thiamine phosphate synthase [Mammaliicoccus fleurettii]|nr:thiamine phosphate synthase [Mammaliicoccus fleurettii]